MTRNKAYEVLGVNSNASIDEIKAAYAVLSKKYHPEENPKEFQEIHDAYIALTRYSRNRIRNTYAFSVNLFNQNEKFEQENFVIEDNKFDFSSIKEAKRKEHAENLHRMIKWLEDVRYSDKEIDHVLLKVILNYNNREIIYSKEFVERLIEILKDSYVDDETKNVVMQYIRLWDTSLADRRDILNMLQTVLEERNTEYRTEHYFKKRQEFGKMVLLVMMPVVLMLWLIIDFGATVKMLVCSAIFCGIVFQIFKFCKKKYSKMFSYMVSSLVGFIVLLISYMCELYRWITVANGVKSLHELLLAGFGTSAFIFFAIWKKEND